AQLGERPRRQRRPRPTRAVDDEVGRLLRHLILDALLEEPARDPAGAGDVALGPLVLLAHVDDDRAGPVAVARLSAPPRDDLLHPVAGGLADLRLDVLEVCRKAHFLPSPARFMGPVGCSMVAEGDAVGATLPRPRDPREGQAS